MPKYSIVVPLHNEQENVTDLYDRLKAVMEANGETFEIVLVDGNSLLGKIHVPVQGRISDVLNDERVFLPVETADGSHVAIAKNSIKKVTLPAADQKIYRGTDPHLVLGVRQGASPGEPAASGD